MNKYRNMMNYNITCTNSITQFMLNKAEVTIWKNYHNYNIVQVYKWKQKQGIEENVKKLNNGCGWVVRRYKHLNR